MFRISLRRQFQQITLNFAKRKRVDTISIVYEPKCFEKAVSEVEAAEELPKKKKKKVAMAVA